MDQYSPSELLSKPKRLKTKKVILLSLVVLILIILGSLFYLFLKYPTASPLVSAEYLGSEMNYSHAPLNKEIIGFLPYWDLETIKYIRPEFVSEVMFFSLSADEDGNIIKVVNGQTDPGWRWWKSQTIQNLIAKLQILNDKFSVTVAMQKNSTLEKFLASPLAQQNFISTFTQFIQDNRLDGLNLDFEYDGTPDEKYRDEFTVFSQNLVAAFKAKLPQAEVSVDVFPISAEKPGLYDIPKLASIYDKMIVMSYDYYSPSAGQAGPEAPMNGFKQGKYAFDVTTTYQDYLKVVPNNKLIMGIPYSGWDYPVKDGKTPLSPILTPNDQNGYSAILSYGRMRTDQDINPKNCQWDNLAEEDWCFYTDSSGVDHQVWYEDDKSIGLKEDYLKQNDLAGMAIWTLGYDKDYPNLWDLIQKNFTSSH